MFTQTGLIALAAAFSTALSVGAVSPKRAPRGAAPAAAAAVTADDVAKGIQAFYERSGGFSANFVQVVKKRGLKKGLRRTGHVYLKKGKVIPASKGQPERQENGKMRWDYPNEEIFYFSDGEVLWTYERRERLAVRLPVKNSRLYQATSYLVGQGNLARDFKLALAKSPLKGALALKLVPKEGTQTMRSLTLVVDEKTFAVKASILVDPLGDSTTLHFSKPKYDAVADKVFQWTPPKGVRIKRM